MGGRLDVNDAEVLASLSCEAGEASLRKPRLPRLARPPIVVSKLRLDELEARERSLGGGRMVSSCSGCTSLDEAALDGVACSVAERRKVLLRPLKTSSSDKRGTDRWRDNEDVWEVVAWTVL